MVNKKQLVEEIDSFIQATSNKLTPDELLILQNIRAKLARARNFEDILKWLIELCKLMGIFKDFFDK